MRSGVFIVFLIVFSPALAVEPDEKLDNPILEARARAISAELRCLVCQNETIDDSSAALARDLRILVRERIEAGDSDAQVVDYIVNRYGDFVLLRPRVAPATWVLWFGPLALLAVGGLMIAAYFRRAQRQSPAPVPDLTQEEWRRVKEITEDDQV